MRHKWVWWVEEGAEWVAGVGKSVVGEKGSVGILRDFYVVDLNFT